MSHSETKVKRELKKVTDAGTTWYPMKGIAGLLGEKNPRQMMFKLKDEKQERQFCIKNAAGHFVDMIHISEANVRVLVEKKGIRDDDVIHDFLKRAPEAEQRGIEPEAPAEAEGTREEITPEPIIKPPARKKRKTVGAIKISKKDDAVVLGMSIGTVYKHVKDGKLKEMKGYKEDLLIMELDGHYDRLCDLLKDPENEVKEYWKISIIRMQ